MSLHPRAVAVAARLAVSPSGALHAQEAAPAATPQPTPLPPPSFAGYPGAPFGGKAQTIPERIEAENYDEGGQGVACYDRDPATNADAGYRVGDGVDVTPGADDLTARATTPVAENLNWIEFQPARQ